MGSGIFLQPKSTVPRDCPAGFGINQCLWYKSVFLAQISVQAWSPWHWRVGVPSLRPSHLSTSWLLPALVLISDPSVVQERAPQFAGQILRFFTHSWPLSLCLGALAKALPQGCSPCLAHTAKHQGVLVTPELVSLGVSSLIIDRALRDGILILLFFLSFIIKRRASEVKF